MDASSSVAVDDRHKLEDGMSKHGKQARQYTVEAKVRIREGSSSPDSTDRSDLLSVRDPV